MQSRIEIFNRVVNHLDYCSIRVNFFSAIHQEAIIQLLLKIAISPNVALCVKAWVLSSPVTFASTLGDLKPANGNHQSKQNRQITIIGLLIFEDMNFKDCPI